MGGPRRVEHWVVRPPLGCCRNIYHGYVSLDGNREGFVLVGWNRKPRGSYGSILPKVGCGCCSGIGGIRGSGLCTLIRQLALWMLIELFCLPHVHLGGSSVIR